jgi:hypothetical protein
MSGLSRLPVLLMMGSKGQRVATERTRFAGEVAREVARWAGAAMIG